MAKPNGGPAFSMPALAPPGEWAVSYSGMTLRDWFAGQALAGVVGECLKGSGMVCDKGRAKTVAMICLDYADAMLAERERE